MEPKTLRTRAPASPAKLDLFDAEFPTAPAVLREFLRVSDGADLRSMDCQLEIPGHPYFSEIHFKTLYGVDEMLEARARLGDLPPGSMPIGYDNFGVEVLLFLETETIAMLNVQENFLTPGFSSDGMPVAWFETPFDLADLLRCAGFMPEQTGP